MLYHGTKYTAGEAQYPYDRELPDEYWKELKKPDPYIRYRSQHPIPPATKRTDVWIACLLIAVVGLAAALSTALIKHPYAYTKEWTPEDLGAIPVKPTPAPTPQAVIPTVTPAAPPAPVHIVPRAEPVLGPLTTAGTPMVSGNQYCVTMPDGRHILVTYKGWVDHAANLPKQPLGGANNAAYTETATGHTWIWTVPAGPSNLPQWIDP